MNTVGALVQRLLGTGGMMRPLTYCAAMFVARLAAAQPGLEDPPSPPPPPAPKPHVENMFVNGGILLTVDHFLNAAWMADAGVRLGDLPLAVHASVAKGGSADADNGGVFWRWTAGLEARTYPWNTSAYLFGDVDIGYQHQTWGSSFDGEFEVHRGGLAIGRAGIDLGGDNIRFRAAFELYRYHREFVTEMTTWQTGGGITLAIGYRN